MTVWPKLSVCLVLLPGCRQPNPEWTGPADGDAGVDTAADTAADTVVNPTTGPSATTMPPDGSDGPEVVTEGQDCNNDNKCPDGWLCGPMGCQQGGDGDPCEVNGDCQAPTDICGPAMVCQSGEAGQPCMTPNHCASGLACTDGVCASD